MSGSQASTGGSSCGNTNYSPWGSNAYPENIYNNPMPYPPPNQQQHRFAPQAHPHPPAQGSNCCGGPASVSGGVAPHQYRNFTNEFQPKRCPPPQQQRQCGSCDALTSPQTPLLPNPDWFPTHTSHPNGIYACNSDCSDHSLKSHLQHSHNNGARGRGKRHHHHTATGHSGKGGHAHNGFGPSHSNSELKGCCNGDQPLLPQHRHHHGENMDGCDIGCLNGGGGGCNNSSSSSSNNNCSSNNSSINIKSVRLNRSASSGCGNGSTEDCDEDSQQQLVKQTSLSSKQHSHPHSHHSHHKNGGIYNHYEECGVDVNGMDCCSMSRDANEDEEEAGNVGGCCEDDTCCSGSESSCLYAEAVEPVSHQAQIIRVGHN